MGNNVGRPTNASIRNKKVLKFISIFVILLGVFLLGYYSYNKVNHKNKCDEACPITNENKVEFAFMLLMDEIYDGNNQTKKFTYDNKEYTLVYETDEEGVSKFLLNDKEINRLYPGPCTGVSEIYLLSDSLLFIESGCLGDTLKFIDLEGNVFKVLDGYINETSDAYLKIYNTSVENKVITLTTTAQNNGGFICYREELTEVNDDLLVNPEQDEVICDVQNDSIVEATYTIEYLGNKIFIERGAKDTKTFAELVKEYNEE